MHMLVWSYNRIDVSNWRKGEAVSLQDRLLGLQEWSLRLPEFLDFWPMKIARLSALNAGHLYPQETSMVLIFVRS